MKKTLILGVAAATLLFSGCAVRPSAGALFTDATVPVTATASTSATKKGVSDKCTSILGLISTGDCSIANAKAHGGIKNVSSVDYKLHNILGIIYTGQTVVTGN